MGGINVTFTEKLDYLMKKHGLTRGSLAKATGIPYTTIVGFYERDSDSIRPVSYTHLDVYKRQRLYGAVCL